MAEVTASNIPGAEGIAADCNFQQLAARGCGTEEFNKLLAECVGGYIPRKRFTDGLKDLLAKVEAIENKISVMKAVGKAKKLEEAEQALSDNYSAPDLKEKVATLNTSLQAMLESGQFTAEEKPIILDNLRTRRDTAKAADKAKLLEKLERTLTAVIKAEGKDNEPPCLPELARLNSQLQYIDILEKKPSKNVTKPEVQEIAKKAEVKEKLEALGKGSRMWFETDVELDSRIQKSLRCYAENEKERKKKEEEDAFEKMKIEQDLALAKKKNEALEKEKKVAADLKAKLEAKRLEALGKPVKEIPKAKPKPKKRVMKIDIGQPPDDNIFEPPTRGEDVADAEEEARPEEETEINVPEDEYVIVGKSDIEEAQASLNAPATGAVAVAVVAKQKPADDLIETPEKVAAEVLADTPAPPKAPKVPTVPKEPVWKNPGQVPDESVVDEEVAGPSLADALAAKVAPIKKTPPPQPKKKEKKKMIKLGAGDLGFEC